MHSRQITWIVAILLAVSAAPLAAHHSIRATFNADTPVTLTGTVTAVEWINPHVHIVVEFADGQRIEFPESRWMEVDATRVEFLEQNGTTVYRRRPAEP